MSRQLTAKNYLRLLIFFSLIFSILRPGGIWVNLGPLLYHYSDISSEGSIEPTYEDLLLIIRGCGFEILVSYKLDCMLCPSPWFRFKNSNIKTGLYQVRSEQLRKITVVQIQGKNRSLFLSRRTNQSKT